MDHIFAVVLFHGTSHLLLSYHPFVVSLLFRRPLNSTPSGSSADILIHQRYFFDRKATYFGGPPYCTEADVTAQTTIPVSGTMSCMANCSSSTYSGLSIAVQTTDCNTLPIISSWGGERYDLVTLPLTTSIAMGFAGSAWLTALYGGGTGWSVVNRLNLGLRPDGFINSSPVTTTLPVIFYPIATRITHTIQMTDNDGTDILQCRWSNSNSGTNYNRADECSGVCSALPSGYVLTGSNCTVSFTLPTANLYYACSIQIEDYYNSAATSPMSSVPIVFLFYGYVASSTACSQRPQIIGVRPNRGMN